MDSENFESRALRPQAFFHMSDTWTRGINTTIPHPSQHTGASLLHPPLSHCPLCCALLLWMYLYLIQCLHVSFDYGGPGTVRSRGPVRG